MPGGLLLSCLEYNSCVFCFGGSSHEAFTLKRARQGDFWDAFTGYIMIDAPRLEYDAVITALDNGDFYASMGPLIKEIYLEGNKFCVRTSEAAEIRIVTAGRNGVCVLAEEGRTVSYAEHELISGTYDFVRVEVLDHNGRIAISRGYFEDEIENLIYSR